MLEKQIAQTLAKAGVCPEHVAVIEANLPLIIDTAVDSMRLGGWTVAGPKKSSGANDDSAGGDNVEN